MAEDDVKETKDSAHTGLGETEQKEADPFAKGTDNVGQPHRDATLKDDSDDSEAQKECEPPIVNEGDEGTKTW